MVMSNPDERFTAKEALAFADSIVPTVYPEARIDLGPEGSIYYCFVDIWEGLPPDFVAKWAHYREDRQTLSFRILNYLFANTRYGIMFVYRCRQAARMLLCIPRLLYRPSTLLSRHLIWWLRWKP